jgi:hypothetical protein
MSAKSEKPTTSILDRADACTLLHQGGEADVYELSCGEDRYALKWYHAGSCFDDSVVDRLKHLNVPGLYRVRESGTRDNTAYLVYDFLDGANSAEAPAMPVVVALKLLRSLVLTLDLMDKESWITASDAVEYGLIDEIADSQNSNAIRLQNAAGGMLPRSVIEKMQAKRNALLDYFTD